MNAIPKAAPGKKRPTNLSSLSISSPNMFAMRMRLFYVTIFV